MEFKWTRSGQTVKYHQCLNTCVLNLACSCEVVTRGETLKANCRNLPAEVRVKRSNQLRYGINLIILGKYFQNHSIAGDYLFTEQPVIKLPSRDAAWYYARSRLLSNSQQAHTTEHSQNFPVWLSVSLTGDGLLMILIMCLAHRIWHRSVTASIAALTLGQITQATAAQIPKLWEYQAPLATQTPMQSSMIDKVTEYLDVILQIDTLNILQLLTLLLIAGTLMCISYRLQRTNRNTKIVLEIGTQQSSVDLQLLSVPHDITNYEIHAERMLNTLQLVATPLPKLAFDWQAITFKHKYSQMSFTLPQTKRVFWFTAYRILAIIQNRSKYHYLLWAENNHGERKLLNIANVQWLQENSHPNTPATNQY